MKVQIKMSPHLVNDEAQIVRALQKAVGHRPILDYKILRRSIDARGQHPKIVLTIETNPIREKQTQATYPDVSEKDLVHIVGTGPAGYFAALQCIQQGLRPILFERGKDVRSRRRDLRALQQYGIVHPHSNYCFGEGGAGTYSDGKLYTRSLKRGNVKAALQILVDHGAHEDILIDAHPHIGSNKLPHIIANLRSTILDHGGQVYFDTCVTNIMAHNGRVVALQLNDQREIPCSRVILATGHSARDIFSLLHKKGWALMYKPFAMGVRIEHSQELIDKIQYGPAGRTRGLPASSYSMTCQVDNRGVFSFCMCPGGLIVPASTAPGELVVNGMSLSRRDSPFANSGTVVEVLPEEVSPQTPLSGMEFQADLEKKIWSLGDGTQRAPAQRLVDFVEGRYSQDLPSTSYIPGILSHRMDQQLPAWMAGRLQQAIRVFGRKMKGYYTNEALVVGLESRTSSPVRIPRKEDGQHPELEGLFPCGEGAGYAGGILSAALDGQKVAQWVAASLSKK